MHFLLTRPTSSLLGFTSSLLAVNRFLHILKSLNPLSVQLDHTSREHITATLPLSPSSLIFFYLNHDKAEQTYTAGNFLIHSDWKNFFLQ